MTNREPPSGCSGIEAEAPPQLAQARFPGYRRAAAAYLIGFLLLTFPFWLQGEVVAPSRQQHELAAPAGPAERVENPKFGDYWSAFVPEVTAQLRGPRSGWLATWSGANAMGRPLSQLAGFSPAYLPSLLLGKVAHSAERYLTILSLASCFLAGMFVLLACRELGLCAWAALLAGGSVGASPFFMYWLAFPMFPAVWCWSAGTLWGLARMSRARDLASWSIVAFSVYSLLMTAYLQPVAYHGYLLAGYAAHLAYCRWRTAGSASAAAFVLACVCAVAAAIVLALPVYADVARTAADSARLAADPSFFAVALPKLDSLDAALRWLALATFPELFGNPVSPAYPFPYDGLSITPLVAFLAVAALLLRFREGWGWWLAIVVLLALAFVHPLYLFGVKHLGFNISRSTPLGTLMLPMAMVAAQGADALLRRQPASRAAAATALAASAVVGLLVLAIAFGLAHPVPVRWDFVAIVLAVAALLGAQLDRARPALLLACLVVSGAYSSYPLMLREPPSRIARTSPLVEKIRGLLAPGSRYAVVAPGIGVLPPNVNATLGLASVHGYDSLSSRRYHSLVGALGGRTYAYGRWNDSIAPDYGGAPFWMSDVSLVLSPREIAHANLAYAGREGEVRLYRVLHRMGCCVQVPSAAGATAAQSAGFLDPADPGIRPVKKTVDLGDRMEIAVEGDGGSLLVLSQAFHPDWHARALSDAGWAQAPTLPVAGFFQGVLVPRGTRSIELEFRPWASYAWIAHGFWIALLVVFAFRARRQE